MRYVIPVSFMAILLAGCDDNQPPKALTPEMASFSNEFDFDPVRGPVKKLTETLLNEDGKVERRFHATLSQEGCFNTMDMHDVSRNTDSSLLLNANYYVNAITQEKLIRLQGKCQLESIPAAGVTYQTNDNDFVTGVSSKDLHITYRYAANGFPLGRVTRRGDQTLEIRNIPVKDTRKLLDYQTQTWVNGKQVSQTVQTCDYDRHDNPTTCEIESNSVTAQPATQTRYTVKYEIEYY